MKEYNPKSNGVFYLRRLVAKAKGNPKIKYITMSVEKAQEITEQANQMAPNGLYTARQNSVRAAALILCVDVSELCVRMNGKTPKEYMNEIAELRNRIKQMESVGDKMAEQVSGDAVKQWIRAKSL